MEINLLDGKFHIEVLDRYDRHYEICYHRSISKNMASIDYIRPLLKSSFSLFNTLNLPIALKVQGGKKYKLVARYWVLQYLADHHKEIRKFPAIIFEDEKLVQQILELEKLENDCFLQKQVSNDIPKYRPAVSRAKLKHPTTTLPVSKFRSTNNRRSAKSSGRTCPFCPGSLVKATGKYNESQGNLLMQDGPHKISCGYKNIPRYNCSFVVSITDSEFERFKDKDNPFPTTEWIELLPGKKCPDCGDKVYKRTKHNNNSTVEIWERCRKTLQSKDNTCWWANQIK